MKRLLAALAMTAAWATLLLVVAGCGGDAASAVRRIAGGKEVQFGGVTFDVRVWYNPNLSSRDYNVPAVMGNIVMLMALLLTSLAVVRDKFGGARVTQDQAASPGVTQRPASTQISEYLARNNGAADPGALHAKKMIRLPSDIKGMKIRPAHATMANWMTSLGATTVQVSAPEAREALERGVADAITFPWNSIISFGIDKVATFHTDMRLYAATFVWTLNKGWYDKLAAGQKKVIDDHKGRIEIDSVEGKGTTIRMFLPL